MSQLKAYCGALESLSGKVFTEETLRQHQADCLRCRYAFSKPDYGTETPLADMIGDDLPDGAFWALAMELGEL